MAADDLAMKGARASVVKVLTWYSHNLLVSELQIQHLMGVSVYHVQDRYIHVLIVATKTKEEYKNIDIFHKHIIYNAMTFYFLMWIFWQPPQCLYHTD